MPTQERDKSSWAKPIVCYVTDRNTLGVADPVRAVAERIRAAVAAGADWVQIREKDMPGRELLELVRGAVGSVGRSSQVIVSDRLDIAIAGCTSGVHLGHESLPAADVARWCRAGNAPSGFLVGVSCHSLIETRAAQSAEADYIFFGPVFDTPSKRKFGPPQGTERLAEVCRAVRIPVIAIGGVGEENAGECLKAGASGIAAIRLFQDRNDQNALANRVARIRAEFRSRSGEN
jgi:thiamine-phosphate pyrophosphorylase